MNDADYAAGATTEELKSITRRSFLGVLLGFGTVVVGAALSVPLIRFALHPLLTRTTEIGWSDVGKMDEFASLSAPMKKIDYGGTARWLAKDCFRKSNLYFADEGWGVARALASLSASWLFDSVDRS